MGMAMVMSANYGVADPVNDARGGIGPRMPLIAALAGLALVSVMMLRNSLAFVVAPIDPELALRIDPGNAEAATLRAEQLLRTETSASNRAVAEMLARRALNREPVMAGAARVLAVVRGLAGDEPGARRLMTYSESVSRRDLMTQLWLIQDAVDHNDIPAALRHYDTALRTVEAAKQLLFPIMVPATGHPAVVENLIRTLAARPVWADAFLAQVSANGPDLDGMATLLAGLARRGYPLPDAILAQATSRLVEGGRYQRAWQVYTAARPADGNAQPRDGDFEHVRDVPSPFDWSLPGGNGVSAEPQFGGVGNRLIYFAATGAGGVIARQLLLLGPGSFSLQVRGSVRGAPIPRIRLTCAGGGRVIGAAGSSALGTGEFAFAGRMNVPAGCPAQWFELLVDGGADPAGASGAIGPVRILSVATGVTS